MKKIKTRKPKSSPVSDSKPSTYNVSPKYKIAPELMEPPASSAAAIHGTELSRYKSRHGKLKPVHTGWLCTETKLAEYKAQFPETVAFLARLAKRVCERGEVVSLSHQIGSSEYERALELVRFREPFETLNERVSQLLRARLYHHDSHRYCTAKSRPAPRYFWTERYGLPHGLYYLWEEFNGSSSVLAVGHANEILVLAFKIKHQQPIV